MKEVFVNGWLGLLSLFVVFLGLTGCEEHVDGILPEDGLVTVPLSLGFADDSSDDLSRNRLAAIGSPQSARRNRLAAIGSPQSARRNRLAAIGSR